MVDDDAAADVDDNDDDDDDDDDDDSDSAKGAEEAQEAAPRGSQTPLGGLRRAARKALRQATAAKAAVLAGGTGVVFLAL